MNRKSSRVGLYLILIIMMIAGYLYLNEQINDQSSYTLEQMEKALDENQVSQVSIHQNRQGAPRRERGEGSSSPGELLLQKD